MDPIYNYSLCAALPLMLFFGFYFLFARTPEKSIFDNFLRSRRIMGAAMLLLAANYSVHFFMKVRFNDADAAILMSIPFYIYLFLCYLNYMLFYEQVENAMEVNEELDHFEAEPMQDAPSYHAEISERI